MHEEFAPDCVIRLAKDTNVYDVDGNVVGLAIDIEQTYDKDWIITLEINDESIIEAISLGILPGQYSIKDS